MVAAIKSPIQMPVSLNARMAMAKIKLVENTPKRIRVSFERRGIFGGTVVVIPVVSSMIKIFLIIIVLFHKLFFGLLIYDF